MSDEPPKAAVFGSVLLSRRFGEYEEETVFRAVWVPRRYNFEIQGQIDVGIF